MDALKKGNTYMAMVADIRISNKQQILKKICHWNTHTWFEQDSRSILG